MLCFTVYKPLKNAVKIVFLLYKVCILIQLTVFVKAKLLVLITKDMVAVALFLVKGNATLELKIMVA